MTRRAATGWRGRRSPAPGRRPRRRWRTGADRGVSSLEFVGMLPLVLFVGMAVIQLGIVGYTVQQAGTAARAAARTAAQEESKDRFAGAGTASVSDWLADGVAFAPTFSEDEVTVTATVTIPSIVPGIGSFGSASKTVTMPRD